MNENNLQRLLPVLKFVLKGHEHYFKNREFFTLFEIVEYYRYFYSQLTIERLVSGVTDGQLQILLAGNKTKVIDYLRKNNLATPDVLNTLLTNPFASFLPVIKGLGIKAGDLLRECVPELSMNFVSSPDEILNRLMAEQQSMTSLVVIQKPQEEETPESLVRRVCSDRADVETLINELKGQGFLKSFKLLKRVTIDMWTNTFKAGAYGMEIMDELDEMK
jgi:hypothetical protein